VSDQEAIKRLWLDWWAKRGEESMKIVMHDYRCLERACGFHWRQQVLVEPEACIACGSFHTEYNGPVERELPVEFKRLV
jgi:predicted Zn-ribbon and HTH transcriptional regulator